MPRAGVRGGGPPKSSPPLFTPELTQTYRGKGCRHCDRPGYKGRAPLYEVLVPDDAMKELIASGATVTGLTKMAESMDTKTPVKDAQIMVDQGLTSPTESLRVLGSRVRV